MRIRRLKTAWVDSIIAGGQMGYEENALRPLRSMVVWHGWGTFYRCGAWFERPEALLAETACG